MTRMGATHFLTKTLPKVAAEMALSVLAYNLTRVMNIVGTKPLMAAIAACDRTGPRFPSTSLGGCFYTAKTQSGLGPSLFGRGEWPRLQLQPLCVKSGPNPNQFAIRNKKITAMITKKTHPPANEGRSEGSRCGGTSLMLNLNLKAC
jgi:hypothetical protein